MVSSSLKFRSPSSSSESISSADRFLSIEFLRLGMLAGMLAVYYAGAVSSAFVLGFSDLVKMLVSLEKNPYFSGSLAYSQACNSYCC